MTNQTTPAGRITVAEAFRRLQEAIRSNNDFGRYPDHKELFSSTTMRDVNEVWVENEPTKAHLEKTSGKDIAVAKLNESFLAFCAATGVTPRNLHDPWASKAYTGSGSEPFAYDIAIFEYQNWAAPYLEPTITRSHGAPSAVAQQPALQNESAEVVNAETLSKRERQICAIEQRAKLKKFDLLMIPTGGKSLLRDECLREFPDLFGAGPDPFNDAWKDAISKAPPRLRMADHEKFGNR